MTDTIESLAFELGTQPSRKPEQNRDGVMNVEAWLRHAVMADAVDVELGDVPTVRMCLKHTVSTWTWPASWPHDRLRALIEKERAGR